MRRRCTEEVHGGRCYGRGAHKVASFSCNIYFQHRTRLDQRDGMFKQHTCSEARLAKDPRLHKSVRFASGAEFHSATDATTLIPRPFTQGCFSANAPRSRILQPCPSRPSDFEKQFAGLAGSYGGPNTS